MTGMPVTRRTARYLLLLQGRSASEAARAAGYSHVAPFFSALDRIEDGTATVATITKIVDALGVAMEHVESGWIFDADRCREIESAATTAARVAAWIFEDSLGVHTLRSRCGDQALYIRVRRTIDNCPDVTEEQRIEAAFAIGCSVEKLAEFRGRR